MKKQKLKKWYEEISLKYLAHQRAANISDLWNNVIGFIAVIAGIIAGFEIYNLIDSGTLITKTNTGRINWKFTLVIIIALFSVIAAISNAAIKFFGFETRKQRHKSSAATCAALKYEMEALLLNDESSITTEIYSRIQRQLSDIAKNAPLLKESTIKKARIKLLKNTLTEIPSEFRYDMKLFERWKVNELDTWKIKKGNLENFDNSVRTYICEPLELIEYPKSKRIFIKGKHIMERDKKQLSVLMQGDGTVDNNTAFITYNVSDENFSTYGSMILNFTNKIKAKGLWMTANVKEANLLVGTVELNLIIQ